MNRRGFFRRSAGAIAAVPLAALAAQFPAVATPAVHPGLAAIDATIAANAAEVAAYAAKVTAYEGQVAAYCEALRQGAMSAIHVQASLAG